MVRLNIFSICFTTFAVACFVLLINQTSCQNDPHGSSAFGSKIGGPTMTFLYCYSCGYKKAYEEYVTIINRKYPEISVRGANYNPPGFNIYLSKLVLVLKLAIILLVISSYDIFGIFGQATPSWWRFCIENKLYACMMLFFVGNLIESQLIASGAFEITLNDIPVWSKLQTGRIPSTQELFQIIESHFLLSKNLDHNPKFVKLKFRR